MFLPFFIILLVALIFSALSYQLHFPWVVALIFGGIIIGPEGLGVIGPSEIFEFFGEVGLVFLMFIAGLETSLSKAKEVGRGVATLVIFNGVIPFITGFSLGYVFDYSLSTSLLIGVIFISSSIAVIVPSLQSSGLMNTKLGRMILGGAMVEDILSLILISVLLQTTERLAEVPLFIFYPVLILILILGRKFALVLRTYFSIHIGSSNENVFQRDVRILLVLMTGTVVLFDLLGLHSIIAGFFAGFVLSDSVDGEFIMVKLRALGYGLFIPIFFVLVGTKTDIDLLISSTKALWLVFAVVAGSILSKFLSGYLVGKLSGFSNNESFLIGSSTIPQLSTTLAVAFIGSEYAIIDDKLLTAIVSLTIASTLIGPILTSYFSKQIKLDSKS